MTNENPKNGNSNNKISRDQEFGALWLKKSKAGSSFLSGYVLNEDKEKVQVVVFKNNYKKAGDPSPDYRIYLSENKNQNSDTSSSKQATKTTAQVENPENDQADDDIPF